MQGDSRSARTLTAPLNHREAAMRFSFPFSHAFHRGHVEVADDGATALSCPIAFSDDVAAIGTWARTMDGMQLDIPACRTARRTAVPARSWRLVRERNGDWRSERMS